MVKCPKCQKEVYFAERVTSLGKDWHRPCLKCEKCNKTLSAGSHAEASRTVTTPATLQCLDLKDSDVVELKATPTNRRGEASQRKNFAGTRLKKPNLSDDSKPLNKSSASNAGNNLNAFAFVFCSTCLRPFFYFIISCLVIGTLLFGFSLSN